MVQLNLPKNSIPVKGNSYSNVDLIDEQSQQNHDIRIFNIYRWSGQEGTPPQIDRFEIDVTKAGTMVLDILNKIKAEIDPSLTFRKSCREGVCGSDGMNINGKNGLACVTPLSAVLKRDKITLRPMPGLPVVRDLIVDMKQFFDQLEKVKPYLITKSDSPDIERKQTPEDREELDGLYECILCGCCSTSCPSFWWNPDKFLGPAALLQSWRFIADSRDEATEERLDELEDAFSLYRCHGIMNCVSVCPKGLNPNEAIGEIKSMLLSNKNKQNIITSDKVG